MLPTPPCMKDLVDSLTRLSAEAATQNNHVMRLLSRQFFEQDQPGVFAMQNLLSFCITDFFAGHPETTTMLLAAFFYAGVLHAQAQTEIAELESMIRGEENH